MTIFVNVVLPAILIFLSGFVVQRWKKMDLKSISTLAVYILTPALVFRTFYDVQLDQQYVFITVFSLILLFVLIIINKVYAKFRKYPRDVESGLILSTAFMNAGNYGAPIILFAYGETGFAYAVSFMVLQSVIMNFFGVYYAASGQLGFRAAIKTISAMPLTYAMIIAILFNLFNIPLSANLYSAVDLVGQATIPVVMLILGMQLAELKVDKVINKERLIYGTTVRMFVSPLIAFIFVMLFPVDPLLAKVLIVLTAMPTAVTTTMYALQFNTTPKLVSSIALVTTLVSVVTISILLTILG
ncbi:MAG: AEC family transporter [Bacillaceae bacterium]|uniref:AEC family transporter n=1 Tax=Alkalihalobacterium chitinilyticum TaxID=2980103 RepID=A0ABT5VJF9_9BACI|nr:AEC family transporter [Alkalihalobacterium chitinilyticum]MDE5415554.1 AEC family transporter [Alkalihalobacterium chitinilyticum]MEB1809333.1 AEC family transporter [Bacillaceae bacterium]